MGNSDLGNKEVMAYNIRKYMDRLGKSRNDICKDLGIKYTTFTDWINAKTYPRIDKIEMMANYFNVTKSDLVESEPKKNHEGTCRMVPLFETVSAGTGAFADSNVIDYIPIPEDLKGNLYAVKVRGDSMTPLIMDGDILIVDKDSRVQNMDTVIATVNGDDGFVKRLARYATGIALVSNNPAYPPLYFSMEDVENKPVLIQGRVKRIIRDI